MTIEIAAFRKQFTRRAALGGAAALVAVPGFAEDCPIGPPSHAKGPLVWMDMDQVERAGRHPTAPQTSSP